MSNFSSALEFVFGAVDDLPKNLAGHRQAAKQAASRLFKDAATLNQVGIFVSTGDIDAMWLRDSSFQIKPLIRFCANPSVRAFVEGVIRQQAFFVSVDPMANAFNSAPNSNCWHRDFDDQNPWVFERKWEIDSLASFLDVSLSLAEATGDARHLNEQWWQATSAAIEVFESELNHKAASYRLYRPNAPQHDFLANDGYGAAFKPCGFIWSAFRPSDDACELPFNVPQNAYAASVLRRLSKFSDSDFSNRSLALASTIETAIDSLAIADGHFVYEIDGLGQSIFMDDANVPSLLSLPYLGFCKADDETYLRTRAAVLSPKNPWYFSGSVATHIGSPHTGKDRVWPLAMAMEILTSENVELEKLNSLFEIAQAGNGFHESVAIEDPADFTREWFSWAEMTYFDAVFETAEKLAQNPLNKFGD